jgi:hypothetical protein
MTAETCRLEFFAHEQLGLTVELEDGSPARKLQVSDAIYVPCCLTPGRWKLIVTSLDDKGGMAQGNEVGAALLHSSQQKNDDRDCYVATAIGDLRALAKVDFA